MAFCFAPSLIGSVLGTLLTACIIGLVLVADRKGPAKPHDWEQAYGALEQKLRQPVRYRVQKWLRGA